MKKFLAILLCLSMLICMIPLVASAEDNGETPQLTSQQQYMIAQGYVDEELNDIPDDNWEPVTTLAEFKAMAGNVNYYLKNDIAVDLTVETSLPLVVDANKFYADLDGCGYSVVFEEGKNSFSWNNSGGLLFATFGGNVIKNLTVGSEAVPVNVTLTKAGGTNFGIIAQKVQNANSKRPLFENITVYANISQSSANQPLNTGLLFGEILNNAYLINCKAVGTIKVNTGVANVGGFVGLYRPVAATALTLRVVNCISDVEFSTYNSVKVNSTSAFGGLLGALKLGSNESVHDRLEAYNCLVVKDLPGLTANEAIGCGANAGPAANCVVNNCAFLSALADGLELTTENAASIRFNAPTGIRFYNTVSGLYDTLVNYYGAENVKMGTIIAPKALIETAGAFTKEALGSLNSTTPTYLDVEFENEWYKAPTSSSIGNADVPVTVNTKYEYVGSIVNILEDNYTLEFCGIGYISYNDGTGWKTIYADCGEQGIPAFTVRGLAEAVNADPDATDAEKAAVAKYLAQ